MSESIGLMLVTYSEDIIPARKFVDSFNKFNRSGLKLYIVISSEDSEEFLKFTNENVEIVFSEDIPTKFAEESFNGITKGYLNQEIVKLSFHRLNLLDNYLCCDSDGEFIRDFYESDFMATSSLPLTVCVQDKELMSDPSYEQTWRSREIQIRKIYDFYGLSQPQFIETCHGFQVLSSRTLRLLESEILKPSKIDFIDLIKLVPYEFSWYTIYHSKVEKEIFKSEPFFKTYHNESQLIADLVSGKGPSSIGRGYLGVVVNGNFQHANRLLDRESELGKVLGYYVPIKVLLTSLLVKTWLAPFFGKQALYPLVDRIRRIFLPKRER
jgi:hypothetical protein